MKLAIWIIGGSGCGKTTLAMEIHKIMAEMTDSKLKPEVIGWGHKEREFMFTRMSKYSANLGEFGHTACSGTDTLSTKDRISTSYLEAIKHVPIVIIEGIMSTMTWIHFIRQPLNTKVFLIHLEISPEENFKRVRRRRAEKQGISQENVVLAPKTLENLKRKLKTFKSQYRQMNSKVEYHLSINCEVLDQARTVEIVKRYMLDHILS